jgi:hypothetical protein
MKGINHICEDQKKSEYRARTNKNDAYHVHYATKTNDALRKQQSMPNDAALYIDGIGNWFIAFTCSFEDFCVRTLVF